MKGKRYTTEDKIRILLAVDFRSQQDVPRAIEVDSPLAAIAQSN